MDEYTRRTRAWLDSAFTGSADDPYIPLSPVHGFDPQSRYLGTYSHLFAILCELGRYEFSSYLEIGAGEGLLCELVRRIFGVPVAAVDLSWSANQRARQIFGLRNAVGEARQLPLKDHVADLVVSVNALEHVVDVPAAFSELMRVARSVVVIGMPHARRPSDRESIDTAEPHAHVSMLTRAEMRSVFGSAAVIRGSVSQVVRPLYACVASDDVAEKPGYEFLRRFPLRAAYRAVRGLGHGADPRRLVAWYCRLERLLSAALPRLTYESIIVRELPGARRRPNPVPPERILAELLR